MTLAASMSLRCATGSHGDAPRCCAKSPLEVVIRLLPGRKPGRCDHPSIVDLPTTGLDLGDEPGVAGEMVGRREAVDGSDFAIDYDGEDLRRAWDRLDELDGRGHLHPFQDASLQPTDLLLHLIQQFEFLLHAALGLIRQGANELHELHELRPPLGSVDVALGARGCWVGTMSVRFAFWRRPSRKDTGTV